LHGERRAAHDWLRRAEPPEGGLEAVGEAVVGREHAHGPSSRRIDEEGHDALGDLLLGIVAGLEGRLRRSIVGHRLRAMVAAIEAGVVRRIVHGAGLEVGQNNVLVAARVIAQVDEPESRVMLVIAARRRPWRHEPAAEQLALEGGAHDATRPAPVCALAGRASCASARSCLVMWHARDAGDIALSEP
jgi:hypothetical protein